MPPTPRELGAGPCNGAGTAEHRPPVVDPRRRRAVCGPAVLALLLALPALAGCGSGEEDRVQNVAFCPGSSGEEWGDGPFDVEFRLGDTVVASGSVSTGAVFAAQVPVGGVQIYVDGVRTGSANEGVATDGPYRSPAPDEFVYLAGEGCPDTPPPLATSVD